MADKKKRNILPLLVIGLLVIILVFGGLYVYVAGFARSLANIVPQQSLGSMQLNISPIFAGAVTYNNAKYVSPYTVLKYKTINATNLTVTFGAYPKNPLPNIFYLNTTDYCYQCYSQSAVLSNLTIYFRKYGLVTNQTRFQMVNRSQLGSIPNNSIIVIASGLLPIYLLPAATPGQSGLSIIDLVKRGDTIVYVGDNFNRSIGADGVIFSSSNTTMSTLRFAGLETFSRFTNRNISKQTFGLNFSSPTYSFVLGKVYSYATYTTGDSKNGSVVALGNLEKTGWNSANSLAGDIAKAINRHFWITPLAISNYVVAEGQPSNGTFGMVSFNTSIPYNSMSQVAGVVNSSYLLVSAVARNSSSFTEKNVPFRIKFSANGTVSMPAQVGQTQQTPISLSINETLAQSRKIVPSIQIYNSNMSLVESISAQFFNTTNVSIIKYATFSLPSGTYFAILRDFSNRYYGGATFRVANLTIIPLGLNFQGDVFSFKLTSNGVPVTGAPYSIDLNGGYPYNGTVGDNGTINYQIQKGTVLEYGTEVFNITIFRSKFSYSTSNIQQVFHLPAIDIEIIIVAISMLILNLILKPPNRDEYYIDVPDFPPVQKVSVKVNKNEITSVFDKVNFNYHWKYMPLTIEEIKNGVSTNVRYNNIPVSITMQNTSMIVNKLIGEGEVITAGGYYAPKRWERDSGHDVEYLTVFRKLRDYCVAHAILFTDIGVSDVADSVLSKGGSEAHIMVYSSVSGIKEIKIIPNVKTFVIFVDEETKLGFTQKLYISYGESAEELKMGISYGYVKLLEADDLSQLIF